MVMNMNCAKDPSATDSPPHSRIFVVFNKKEPLAEENIREEFEKCGEIQGIYMVNDKLTGESKGIAYIKYSKMSEAMLALETFNGSKIKGHPIPLKVHIAKNRSDEKNDDHINPEDFSRLFVTAPISYTEEDIKTYFDQFGEVANIKIIKPKQPSEKRGHLIYITYKRLQDAAKALEADDPNSGYKVVIARPKETRSTTVPNTTNSSEMLTRLLESREHINVPSILSSRADDKRMYTLVYIACSKKITEANLYQLLDIAPGLKGIKFIAEKSPWVEYAATYNSPAAADYAVAKFNGLECPPGEYFYAELKGDMFLGAESQISVGKRNFGDPVENLHQKIDMVTDALHHAKKLVSMAGLTDERLDRLEPGYNKRARSSPYCSFFLPPIQPLVPRAEDGSGMRLFFICHPTAPPLPAIIDVFCRFSNFSGAYIVRNKNFGYAYFTCPKSANNAIEALNDTIIAGKKITVLVANPKKRDSSPSYKRENYTDNM